MSDQQSTRSNPFADLLEALDAKEQRKAMRTAIRRNANAARKVVDQKMGTSGLGQGTKQKLAKSLRIRIYPDRYGLGFMVTTKPRGKRGYHKNRFGKEKPVAMWAEDGTKPRKTRRHGFLKLKKGHNTGSMPAYDFLKKSEDEAARHVEANLFGDFQRSLERRLRMKQLL